MGGRFSADPCCADKVRMHQNSDRDMERRKAYQMTDNEKEEFEERAAIMEYEAGMPRKEAEWLALKHLLQKKPKKCFTTDSR